MGIDKSLNEKLDKILKNQEKILREEKRILGKEEELEILEREELEKEDLNQRTEEETLDELLNLEKKFKFKENDSLKKITKKDLFKGFVGAFFGMMGHFAFYKGYTIGLDLSFYQATVLYFVAFLIIVIMLYFTGFRKVKKHIVLRFMPLRALILYCVSIFTIILIYFLFGKVHFPVDFLELYKMVGASITLAVMGAGTADLIGGEIGH